MASKTVTLSEFAALTERQAQDLQNLDFTPALKEARQLLITDTQENFAGNHGPDGAGWAPLSIPRVRSKGTDLPLRDTGVLMASLSSQSAPGSISNITSTTLEHGTNLDYAHIHQEGGTITPKHGRMLAIPLTREAKQAGNARSFPRPLFLFKRKGKTPLLAEDTSGRRKKSMTWGEHAIREQVAPGAAKNLAFHYLLVPSVTIPARPFLGWTESLLARIDDVFRDFVTEKLG